jgi:hypothetical protein
MWNVKTQAAMDEWRISPDLPRTMPFRRQNHEQIDALRDGPYIAGHEQVVYDPDRSQAPPPSQHGTDARSRVNPFVPPVPRHSSPDILLADSA